MVLRERGGVHRVSIEAFGAVRHTDPRAAPIEALVQRLGDLTAAAAPYEGDRLQVYMISNPHPADPTVANELPWPLPDPPTGGESRISCSVHEGVAAARLLEIFSTANHATRWNHRGTLYQLAARPLLPGEEGCSP